MYNPKCQGHHVFKDVTEPNCWNMISSYWNKICVNGDIRQLGYDVCGWNTR